MAKIIVLLWALALLPGCYYLQQPATPMPQAYYPAQQGYEVSEVPPVQRQRDLLVMLPGMGDGIDRFAHEGLVQQVAQAQLPVDVVVVNAHFNYYRSRTLLTRLQQDVINPAKAMGYQRVHLAGVSLGGFGALVYWRDVIDAAQDTNTAEKGPGAVLLLTPYLGEPEYYQHLLQKNSQAQAVNEEKNLWPWLESQNLRERKQWYLGSAQQDEFYTANQLLAERLRQSNTATVNGGHNWQSWRELWPTLLRQLKRDYYSKVNNYE
ncbi:alpha/beta hydrolase [Gilvimarinus chinensis]|uniref:alpha/beta hydrolase n=1 Tax=Gilvimarinus chinensis TaxID=396005 RepID=UPI00037B2832|nr:alpha/beta hydrolase [Gilvimarinus chinensis]